MRRFKRRCILATLAALAGGCDHSLKPAERSSSYFQDASQCHNEAQQTVNIKINPAGALGSKYGNAHIGGGVYDIPVQMGPDQGQYRVCMEQHGWKTEPDKDPYLAAIDDCRKAAETLATASRQGQQGVKISSSFDNQAYNECLSNRGIDGTVIVHAIQPVKAR